jgi:hypothetical protein
MEPTIKPIDEITKWAAAFTEVEPNAMNFGTNS